MKDEWRTVTFDDIAIVKGGKRVPKGYKFEKVETPHPYITVSDFTDAGTIDTSHLNYLSKEVFATIKNYTISSNDLYLSIAGTIGKTGFVPKELDGANLTENACKLVLNDGVEKKFIFYFTKTNSFIEQAGLNTRTSAQPKLALERLKTITFMLPCAEEQKRIVALLDEAFIGLDATIANTEKNLANARELFDSFLNAVFTEKGKEWTARSLEALYDNLDSRRVPITKSERIEGAIPYYGASGVVDHVEGHLFNEDLLLVSEDGANLLARTYPIAFSVSGKTWVNNHAHVLRFQSIWSQKFVEYYLNSISLAPYVSGMAQPKLNQKALNSIKIPFPPIDIQQEVVEKFDELSSAIRQLADNYRQKFASLNELKQSLLQKAFSGELTAKSLAENALA